MDVFVYVAMCQHRDTLQVHRGPHEKKKHIEHHGHCLRAKNDDPKTAFLFLINRGRLLNT